MQSKSPVKVVGTFVLALVALVVLSAGVASAQATAVPTGDRIVTQAAGFTPEQIANMKERISLATTLVDRLEAEARSLGRADTWRQTNLEALLSMPASGLRSLRSIRSVDALDAAITSGTGFTSTPADFGSTTEDLVYKPIAPCRFIDTRNVGGKINGTRGFDINLTGASYGGLAACDPTALFGVNENSFGGIAMNMTIVDPTDAPGFGAIKPTAASPVTSLINWYQSGASVQAANQGIVTMDQTGAAPEFVIQTSGAVHVIIDIFGAFIAPNATPLDCLAPTALQASYVTANNVTTGYLYSLECPATHTITGGACYSSSNPTYMLATGTSSNQLQWFCQVRNLSGVDTTTYVWARCCRVPGR